MLSPGAALLLPQIGSCGAARRSKPGSLANADGSPGIARSMSSQGANQAQSEKMNGERAGQENKANAQGAQMNREKGAAANQQTGQNNRPGEAEKGKAERTGQATGKENRATETEKGNTAAQGQAPANENRAGQAQTGGTEIQNNRQNAQATGERHVNPQNVRVEGNAHLSNESASRIADTLFATATPQNVNVSIGAALPGNVRLMPLPTTVVDLVPEYRDYDYVLVNDEIVIVQPSTRHVVEIINTGGGATAMATTHVNPCGP